MFFETHVQAAFVVLMLTGGIAPCLPPWPIVKIKLQGRHAGFSTDDAIVFVKGTTEGREAKLLAQIKHSVSITKQSQVFSEVVQAAWADFQNPTIFNAGLDAIALITGLLTATDINDVRTILDWARSLENPDEFTTMVNQAKISSAGKREKLAVFKWHLKKANNDKELSDLQLWKFLRSFYLLWIRSRPTWRSHTFADSVID